MPDTPLGQIVAIRSETDMDIISNFTDAQREIRNSWLNRETANNEQKYVESMDMLFAMARA